MGDRMAAWVPIPVAEGGEAHGGRHECDSQGEGGVSAQEEREHTGHTHGEKLRKERKHTVKSMGREVKGRTGRGTQSARQGKREEKVPA